MSIKQIDQATVEDGKGVGKKIHKGAERLIYDVLQSTQYSTPIASTVRELTTNAWDSQREKEIAHEILTGEKSVDDYFITRDGDQYKDSNFDPSYYDLKKLDMDMEQVELRYTRNPGAGFCDLFEVIDFGVGLGGSRLEGILSLGFSSKRNTTEGFGAFGLGAKVALSTNVPFYSIHTVHNGKKFSCNCYPYKTKFTIPKFNLAKSIENPSIVFEDGTKVYYEETDEKNHTIVSLAVKKHNRNAFEEAIKEQLVYIDNVITTVVDNEGFDVDVTSEVTKAETIYNSESLILSQGNIFNKPHIVIVKSAKDKAGINYGIVDFKELELEEMYGSIGFKCPIRQSYRDDDGMEVVIQEGVSVTPSREKVIWDDPTKKFILSVIEQATKEASVIVEKELGGEDEFFQWIEGCREVFGKLNTETVLGRMSQIINIDDVSPKFPGDDRIQYKPFHHMFYGVTVELVTLDWKNKAKRTEVTKWSEIPSLKHVFIKDTVYSPHKDVFLCKTEGYGSFLTLQFSGLSEDAKFNIHEKSPQRADDIIKDVEKKMKRTQKFIENDPRVKMYSGIDVPNHIKDEVDKIIEKNAVDMASPAERRRLEEREVGFSVRYDQNFDNNRYVGKAWVRDKVMPKKKDLLYSEGDIFYTTSGEVDLMFTAAKYLQGTLPTIDYMMNTYEQRKFGHYGGGVAWFRQAKSEYRGGQIIEERVIEFEEMPQLIQLREDLIRKIPKGSNLTHIDDLYNQKTSEGVLTMHPQMIEAYTALTIGEYWNKYSYMLNFENVDKVIYDKYMELYKYMGRFTGLLGLWRDDIKVNEITKHADELWEFQQFCQQADGEDEIREMSSEMFILSDVKGALAVDMHIYLLDKELTDYNEGVGDLLNLLEDRCFRDSGGIREVQRYLKSAGRDNWSWGND